jgi:hypothetical protein
VELKKIGLQALGMHFLNLLKVNLVEPYFGLNAMKPNTY